MEGPITRDGLFKTLETKLTDSGATHLIKRIQERRVSFVLSDSDEEKIRRLQKGLGQKRLSKLIAAIHNNYRSDISRQPTPTPTPTPTSITQTMTNSPGGIQAGRDVVIQSGSRVIQSLVLRVSVEVETPETKTTEVQTDMGLQSAIALFTKDNTRIRFVTDFRITDQQVKPRLRRLGFVYTPETPNQIQGQDVRFLESVNMLTVKYNEIFEALKFAQNKEAVSLRFTVELNGVEVGSMPAVAAPGVLSSVQASMDVSALFREITKTYNKAVSPQSSAPSSLPLTIQSARDVNVYQTLPARRLTAEQEAQFVKILKDNPKGSVEISCIESGGPEPCDFARQLARLLESKDAGWAVNFSALMFGAGDPTKTIPEMYILVHSDKNPPPRAVVLQYALKTVGYDAVGLERSELAADFVQLTVWFRRQ